MSFLQNKKLLNMIKRKLREKYKTKGNLLLKESEHEWGVKTKGANIIT